MTAASAGLPWFDMTMLYQDKADDGTPEFTIDEIKMIKPHQSVANSALCIEDGETVGDGTKRGGDTIVSAVGDGDTVGNGGRRSGKEETLDVDALFNIEMADMKTRG